MYVNVYTHAHTHTYTARVVLGCEPRGRDKTLGEPEESRWTKSQYTYFCICVCSTRLYMLVGGMRSWTDLMFSFDIFSFRERQAKDVIVIPRIRIHVDLSYIDPPLRELNYFSK